MIKLEELYNQIVIESGNYDLIQNLELGIHNFKPVINKALGFYSKYIPYVHVGEFDLTPFSLDLTGLYSNITGEAPKSVLKMERFVISFYVPIPSRLWRYERPVLYFQTGGRCKLYSAFNHKIVEEHGEEVIKTLSIEDDDLFIDLCSAYFQITISKMRNLVTMDDLPVKFTPDMLTEANESLKEIKQEIKNRAKWFLAI